VKHELDFDRLMGTFGQLWELCHHLAYYVHDYPQQVSAACLLYLAGAKFLTWFRRR
jgi:hypothetical protein